MNKINIITPCTRIHNLQKIAESINIPRDSYRWIVVIDGDSVPPNLPEECEAYAYQDENSEMGNAQRNFAIDMITEGYVYVNDDDTTLHPDLWKYIKNIDADMISFPQTWKDGRPRLTGETIALNYIDSHNFIVKRNIIGDLRWVLDRYDADGVFAEECRKKAEHIVYIPKVLSIYNSLR